MLTEEASSERSSNLSGPPLLGAFQEMRRHWMGRAMAEIDLGLKLSTKLSEAHSVPEAMTAYQEWWSEEINARAEDTRRLMTKGQEFMAVLDLYPPVGEALARPHSRLQQTTHMQAAARARAASGVLNERFVCCLSGADIVPCPVAVAGGALPPPVPS
jgi:hypothetical protein